MNVSLLITHVMQQIKLDYEYTLASVFGQDDISVVTAWMYAYMNMHTFLCTCTHLTLVHTVKTTYNMHTDFYFLGAGADK